ncbi:MAG TPA: TlpA disulfide reductase family protein [Dyadobacter sp.]|jgi:thiol-disulfide isomerase/thioredoxin|nr:TlpA disulfide reductase family protein [Dyadobacter sp.]
MNSRFCSFGKLLPYLFYLILSYFLLTCWRPVQAQQKPVSLKIGDKLPDVLAANVLNHSSDTVKLSDFKGKLLILDFWATWCAPCVTMIPRMDALQKQFGEKVQFLAVTNESAEKVQIFRKKHESRFGKRIKHIEVVSDRTLKNLFFHNSIPHYVWIDKNGVVRAITDMDQITAEKIEAFLKAETLPLSEKKDTRYIPYNQNAPLFAGGNGGDGSEIIYHSLFARYAPGLKGTVNLKRDPATGSKITASNCSRYWLYRIAYANNGSLLDEGSVLIESQHADRLTTNLYGEKYHQWLAEDNAFSYEVMLPAGFPRKANDIMQQDLAGLFPEFSAGMEARTFESLVLERSPQGAVPNAANPKSKGLVELDPFGWKLQNASVSGLVSRFNQTMNYPLTMVDKTGISSRIDLNVEGNVSDLQAINKALAASGLMLTKKQITRQMLVIRDAVSTTN